MQSGRYTERTRDTKNERWRAARQRKKRLTGKKVEGRKSVTENYPELKAAVKRISRRMRNSKPISIKGISEDLHAEGFTTKTGGALSTKTVWTLLNRKGPDPKKVKATVEALRHQATMTG